MKTQALLIARAGLKIALMNMQAYAKSLKGKEAAYVRQDIEHVEVVLQSVNEELESKDMTRKLVRVLEMMQRELGNARDYIWMLDAKPICTEEHQLHRMDRLDDICIETLREVGHWPPHQRFQKEEYEIWRKKSIARTAVWDRLEQ
jgi:hypothetical protein